MSETLFAIDIPTVRQSIGKRWSIWGEQPYGPAGWLWQLVGDGSVIVSQAEHDGAEWLHASVAFADHVPTYEDLAALHRAVFGRRRWSYQVFAPEDSHVNIHANALHLWGRADGQPIMPNFGSGGSI